MSFFGRSLLNTRSISISELSLLFERARRFETWLSPKKMEKSTHLIALVFFEPSTRTRLSFETACVRLGLNFINFGDLGSTSIVKGESLRDSVETILAMKPDLLIVRYGEDKELDCFLSKDHGLPIISGGTNIISHPTQALLDIYTITQRRGGIKGEKILIVGDVTHSRVAGSHFEFLHRLGAQVAVCGPRNLLPSHSDIKQFDHLDEAIEWASVYMALRVQKERHNLSLKIEDYHECFGLTTKRLKKFCADGIILHPGPVNYGIELSPEVRNDSRCCISLQVKNGVLIRMALLAEILGLDISA